VGVYFCTFDVSANEFAAFFEGAGGEERVQVGELFVGFAGDFLGAGEFRDGGGARIANAKAALSSAFLVPTFSTGGAVDKPITINPGSIGGVSLAFTIHTVPDTSTTMGASLDSLRLVLRTFAAVFVVFTLLQCVFKALRRI